MRISGTRTGGALTGAALAAAAIAAGTFASAVVTTQAAPQPGDFVRQGARPAAVDPPRAGVSGRAYVANEATGTVSVIDTDTDTVVATICLGSDPAIAGTPQPAGPCNAEADHHAALYNGHVGTHGLSLTPQNDVLVVTNRISGTVVAVDTTSNEVLGYLPVGREPHLVSARPGGREAWAAIRGENYVEVVDLDRDDLHESARLRTERMESKDKLPTALGPSMITFTSDGEQAFVVAAKEARVDKFDADSRELLASAAVPATFTPFGFVSPDDAELYLVHKGAGTLSVLDTETLEPLIDPIAVGARANHVAFVGRFAYVSVAGPPGGEGKIVVIDRGSKEIVHELTGPEWAGEPHGIWEAGPAKLYVGHEAGNKVSVLDVGEISDPSDDVVAGVITDPSLRKPIDVVVAR